MKKGLILINAYADLPSITYQSSRLKEELQALGVEVTLQKNDGFFARFNRNGSAESPLLGYDFCVYLDKDKYVSCLLEGAGMRLFNPHKAIELCDDKISTFLALANLNIPMPKTFAGLLCYSPDKKVGTISIDVLEKELGYPLIVKECYGSLGKNVYKADNRAQLEQIANALLYKPHLFQEFIKHSAGRDIRVIVVGGKVLCAMERCSTTDFRSNIELGGLGKPFNVDEKLKALCEKVATTLKLDYCGIDILYGKTGYLLCEVNSNAFFSGIEKVTGVNVAKAYAKHIVNALT